MFSLIDEAKLSDIPEVKDTEVSTEAMQYVPPVTNATDVTADNDSRVLNPNIVGYTVTELPSGTGKMVAFYLNVMELLQSSINQFVLLTDTLLTKEDVLMVHFNSALYIEEAETLYNAILSCKAKKKIGSAPYTLNTAALFPAMACDYLIGCPWMFAHFDVPSLRSGGNLLDAKNAFEYDKMRKTRMLKILHEEGFISNDGYENIFAHQGSYTVGGSDYLKIVQKFNSRQR